MNISPAQATLAPGSTLQLSATPSNFVTWVSADPAIATVSPTGLVGAVAPGVTIIYAVRKNQRATVPVVVRAAPTPPDPVPPGGGLLHLSDLQYLGAFRFPPIDGYGYYTRGLAYNPTHHSLVTGGGYTGPPGAAQIERVSEITIPEALSQDPAAYPFAAVLQPPTDVTRGTDYHLGVGGADVEPSGVTVHRGGLLVHQGRLIGTAYIEYDAAPGQQAKSSHWSANLDFSLADHHGPTTVGSLGAGIVAGYLCDIPTAWQARLGGPCLTGQGSLAVISRASYGGSLHAFDPADLAGPVWPLCYYDTAHQTLGQYGNIFPDVPSPTANPVFNAACMHGGAAFPAGWDTVLIVGNCGHGPAGYGSGTADQTMDRQPVPGEPGNHYIYDPYNPTGHGTHAWPYVNQAWALNAHHLAEVKAGTRQPWDVVPYAVWDLSAWLPCTDASGGRASYGAGIVGAAYAPGLQRLYLVQGDGAEWACPDHGPYSRNPLVHVFQLPKTR